MPWLARPVFGQGGEAAEMTATPSPQNDTLQIKATMLAGKKNWPTTKEDIQGVCKEEQWIFRAMRGADVRKRSSPTDEWTGIEDDKPGDLARQANLGLRVRSSFDETFFSRDRSPGDPWNDKDAWKYEAWMLEEFKRAAYHYLGALPDKGNHLEWMALARHYEMPSRLLDFTYSFYVAAYFALSGKSGNGYVLALNLKALKDRVNNVFSPTCPVEDFHDPDFFREVALKRPPQHKLVVPLSPGRRNERLLAQQGLFLCPCDIGAGFLKNLEQTFGTLDASCLRLVVLADGTRAQAIQDLTRMNVSMATLYPDLSGFAQSLRDLVHVPERMPVDRVLINAISQEPWW